MPRSLGARRVGDHDLVQPRRHRVDKLHIVDELSMIFRGHRRADKYGQMAGLGVNGVEDPLPTFPYLIDALIIVEDPVQSLLRGRNVVPMRAEADDRTLDLPDIEANSVAGDDLARGEFVGDKEIVDHPLHLFAAQQYKIAPPLFKLQIAAPL